MEMKPDEEILALSVANPRLFSIIFDRHEEKFRRKVKRILGDRPEVEDVLQETFVKIYLNAGKFKKIPGASFTSWAYKILINVTFTQYKKLDKRKGDVDILKDELREVLPDKSMPDLASKELKDYVESIVATLPDNLGHALTEHFINDKPQEQIAREEGVSVGAIKTRIHRAKEAFREQASKV
ncbi:MAG: RNA polymerase sigma factor [Candidatus Paceibacterota bacterium]|jgi:RNA polymerase sigma-70 factor (ECF subfamily)